MKSHAVVLGAAGIVGGELLRLIASHPGLSLLAACSRSCAGEDITAVFPHLASSLSGRVFHDPADGLPAVGGDEVIVFSALPHGEAAVILDDVISTLCAEDTPHRVVDLSADFRFADTSRWESIYGRPHGAASRAPAFTCGLPDLHPATEAAYVAHPGCFTTAVTLGCSPLTQLGFTDERIVASCVTGSTGSGSGPKPGTHHPRRNSNMWSYQALRHRHGFEMNDLVRSYGGSATSEVVFLPHSGPFARGIHATLSTRLNQKVSADDVRGALASFWEASPFITVVDGMPDLKDVVGSNEARIGVEVVGRELAAVVVIDNLVKGAAGGAIHWFNRMAGFELTTGLDGPAWGWC